MLNTVVVFMLCFNRKSSPTVRGGYLGGVFEYDFLMSKSMISKIVYRTSPIKKWRRRESNPRPNLEPKSFLHAYSVINPLAQDGHRQPNLLPQSLKFRTLTETHNALSLKR